MRPRTVSPSVWVVDPEQRRVEAQRAFQLCAIMDLYQYVEILRLCHIGELGHLTILQRSDDQQNAVSAQGSGLDDLVGVNHKILADDR